MIARGSEKHWCGACQRPSIAQAMGRPGLSTESAPKFIRVPIASAKAYMTGWTGTFCICVP